MDNISLKMPLPGTATNEPTVFILEPILSLEARNIVQSILNVLILIFGGLGVVTNAINIRVFIRQGLSSDSKTICLFTLATADLHGCLFLAPCSLCELLEHTTCEYLAVLVGNVPHLTMSRITCWITVYIAIERCLCVLIPFKVKALLRPRIAVVSMTSIFGTLILIAFIPVVSNFRITWHFSSDLNTTSILLYETATGQVIMKYVGLIFNSILTPTAAILTALATGIMLYKLKQYREWRDKMASTGRRAPVNEDTSDDKQRDAAQGKKDVEILKLVVMFVFCACMSFVPGFAIIFVPGFYFVGINANLYVVFYLYKYFFDVLNSSINFFFYVKISSRYRAAFNEVFRK